MSERGNVFPEQGQPREDIGRALDALCADDLQVDGQAFAFVYDAGKEVKEVARNAFARCMGGNGLDPTVYPSARRLENDIVGAALSHLRAPEGAVGTCTAGGTESVLLSVKTARDYAQKKNPELKNPQMLVPETAHACFHKGAHYFGVELVTVDVDPVTMRASVEDMKSKITDRTVLLVGSAPSYAHGVVDPIVEIGELALKHDILFHVDACIGGWVLPFEREVGVAVPDFDFQVPGVTSISVDLHKYAFAPKGVSVLLHRERKIRDAQYFTCATWSGYSVINTSTLGSKSLAAMGAAWSILRYLGRSGYRDLVKGMWEATETLVKGIRETPGVDVVSDPVMGLVAMVTEDDGDIFELADRLTKAGFHVQPTYAYGRSPAHIHFTVDASNAPTVPALLKAIQTAVVDLPKMQEPPEPVVQMMNLIGSGAEGIDTGLVMRELGVVDGKLPEEQAMIHRLLNAASPATREAILVQFMGELFT
ncbi:MAG: aspartate aminotransferase family protein [Myxococcota bacterium]